MDSQPELFAQHYAEAGLADKSALYWTKAGHRSAARSAMAEAATQFQKGLDQLALLPDTRERQRREIELHIGLAGVLIAAKGPGAPETRRSYDRARELWAQLGCPSEFLGVPYGQSVYHLHRGEFDMAQRLDEDLLRVSRWRNDPGRLVLGHYSCGRTLLYRGQFARARVHLEEAIALYDPIADRLLLQAGIRPWVAARATFCICLFCLGYPDQALAQAALAVAEARELGHLPSLAIGLDHLARLLTFIVDIAALSEPADQLVALAIEQGFSYWRALGNVYRGWAMVKSGDVAAGLSLLRSGAAACRAAGAVLWAPSHLTLLAAASEIAGEMEDALALLDDALTLVERTGGLWLAAELNRCKGQLVLQRGNTEAAEELYRKARSTAAEQGAKLWELRAAVSLARLRRDQNRRAEGRNLLAPVYNWFIEGFETPDLKEAQAVLDTLR